MRALVLGLLAVVALAVAVPAQACACGIALESQVTRERALVIDGDGREVIIASFDLQADGAASPAVVLPVPADPEVQEIEVGDPLGYLDLATLADDEPDTAGAVGGAAPSGGVDVIGRDVIGGYDVSRLRADDPGALDAWLTENGYELPAGAEPILADYVEEGWRYVAIKLAPAAAGSMRPLRVSFDADELVYPMRLSQLGTAPVDLTLYVLSAGERTVDGLEVSYSGAVDELEPPAPPGVDEVLAEGTHLTKLTATAVDPSEFTADLEIGGSGSGSGGGGAGWGPPLAIVLAVLGAGAFVASRRA